MARLTVMLFLACAAATSVLAPTPANALDITPGDIQNAALLLSNLTGAFSVFKELFQKSYSGSSEEQKRYMNFASNLINAAGVLSAQNPLAQFGITPYSDLSESEFAQQYLTKITPFTQEDAESLCNASNPETCDAAVIPVRRRFAPNAALGTDAHRVAYDDLPEQYRRRQAYTDFVDVNSGDFDANAPPKAASRRFAGAADPPLQVDWRTKGVVGPVKYQGECGSCWSFVITGNVESLWAIAGHGVPNLSEQQLLSCVSTNQQCEGGIMQYAYDWIISKNDGYVASEEYYPYVSADGVHVPACNNDGAGAAAHINRYVSISRNEVEMQKYVANNGPVSIAIEAYGWQSYTGGIISKCNNLMTTHAVLVVGYDVTHSPPYWICKNSWSSEWGEGGYLRVEMWKNVCLIADNPSSGLITSELSEALPTGDPSRRVKNAAGGYFAVSQAFVAVSAVVASVFALVL